MLTYSLVQSWRKSATLQYVTLGLPGSLWSVPWQILNAPELWLAAERCWAGPQQWCTAAGGGWLPVHVYAFKGESKEWDLPPLFDPQTLNTRYTICVKVASTVPPQCIQASCLHEGIKQNNGQTPQAGEWTVKGTQRGAGQCPQGTEKGTLQ